MHIPDPEGHDHHEPYPPLYAVVFPPADGRDETLADLPEEWLEPA